MTKLTVELPDDTFAVFNQSPGEFAESMKITAVVKWYEEGRISQSKAAEIAGISRQEFLQQLFIHGVSPFQITPEELRNEVG